MAQPKSDGGKIVKRRLSSVAPVANKKDNRSNGNKELIAENKKLKETVEQLEMQLDYKKKMERFIECGMDELQHDIEELREINKEVSQCCEEYKNQVDYLVEVVTLEQKKNCSTQNNKPSTSIKRKDDVYKEVKQSVQLGPIPEGTQVRIYDSLAAKTRCEECKMSCKDLYCTRCKSGICQLCYDILFLLKNVNDVLVECPQCNFDSVFENIHVTEDSECSEEDD